MEKDILNEQTSSASQTVITEEKAGDGSKEVSFGKFKDAEALLNAYNSLQAEFTKRCQRIKELESKVGQNDKAAEESAHAPEKAAPSVSAENALKADEKSITEEDKELILKDYLKNVALGRQKAIIMDVSGMGIKTPVKRPKTLREAGDIAIEMFK